MRSHRSRLAATLFLGPSLLVLSACGGAPPATPAAPPKPAAVATEPPPDVTAVPEPHGLLLVGRVSRADAILKTMGVWAHLPLPGGADVVRSVTDDSVADAVDVSQPIDGAVALGGSLRDPKPLVAVSVPVKSFDDAKAKLGAKHKLTPGKNGQLFVEGVGRAAISEEARGGGPDDEDDDDVETCVLSPASSGARLVCGEAEAVAVLSPYLTRTVPRQTWASDIHVEMYLAAAREPITQVKSLLPILARSMLGTSSPALAKLVDAGVGEIVDFVNDSARIAVDAQVTDTGVHATLKSDYQSAQSLVAKLATSNVQKADAPPAAFWHLPADTDVAFFGRGSDAKLFDHSKELLGNVFLEATEGAGMPEAERKAVRELVVDRMMSLLTGPLVYGKGYDSAAVDKDLAARNAIKQDEHAKWDEAERVLAEQVFGWHLIQVTEPITKIGPMLKDWTQLWNRPAFAKWAKQQASAKTVAQMRIVPSPAGVTLPKDAVHLQITMPRPDLAEGPAEYRQKTVDGAPGKLVKPVKPKLIPRKPLVLHVLAVPDQGSTWIAFGLDAKLVAQKAAIALSSASESATFGKTQGTAALHDAKASSAVLLTVRGLLVFTALDHHGRSPFGVLATLPDKGATPVTMTFASQGPSSGAAAGSVLATLDVPRATIEDVIRLAMSH